jgi:hypothetical protein
MNYSIRQIAGLDPIDIDGNGDPVYLDHVAYPSVDPRDVNPVHLRYGSRVPARPQAELNAALDALIADLERLDDMPF